MSSKIFALPLLFGCFIFSFSSKVVAQQVKGKVMDARNGDPLPDATVTLKSTSKSYTSITGLDGSFVFKSVPLGSYTQTVNYVGYKNSETAINLDRKITVINTISLKQENTNLQNVVVNAFAKNSDAGARSTERLAGNLLNIISGRAMENSPDITVGNVLKRATGVSIIRNSSGDGENAIIRGMADRYNYTTINGVKLPSPDDKTHSIPIDIFPADVLQRLEVVKSLTPDMEGDAIGGVTNLVLKETPEKFTFTLNGSLGYHTFFNNHTFTTFNRSGAAWRTPYEIHGSGYAPKPSDFNVKYLEYKDVKYPINGTLSGSVGGRINNKLGFLSVVSYQHIYTGSSSLFYPPSGQPQPIPTANTPVFAPIEYRIYNNEQGRLATHLLFDYTPNQRNKISLYTALFQLDEVLHRNLQQGLSQYLHTSGQDYVYDRSQFRRQTIWSNALQGKHQLTSALSADWSLVYSKALTLVPIWIDQQYSDILTYDNGTQKVTSEKKNLQDFPYQFAHSSEDDKSVYLNLHYKIKVGLSASVGGLYRDKSRDSKFESYTLFSDNQPFTDIQHASFPRLSRVDTIDGLTYTTSEKIFAYYGELKWQQKKWEVLGGVRVEHTNHYYWSELNPALPGKTAQYYYTDFLPSVNVKYNFNASNDLRLSYFSGISRPNFFEFVPVTFSGDYFDQQGNPAIKHVSSNNFDLRYEHYFGGEDYFMGGVFYKYIIDPIELSFVDQTTSTYVLEPQNFGNATNFGAEIVFTKYFRNFGIRGNYSYTNSSITTTKLLYYKDADGNYRIDQSTQTRPLQGQSDHIANLSLLYKNISKGIEGELSWVYTGQRIEIVSGFKDLDYWQKANSQLDFSMNVKVSPRFALFAKVTNLTNTSLILELHTNANGYYYNNNNYPDQTSKKYIITRHDRYNQSVFVGFRLK